MQFDYYKETIVNDSITIDNVGCTAIESINDMNEIRYLLINTELGMTNVLQVGPFIPDIDAVFNLSFSYYTLEYNTSKIYKIIDTFLNGGRIKVTQAREVSFEEALQRLPKTIDFVLEKFN